MSKNVAVFVDVANIFYAAKAAGVDIDYVTLLKAASAGRDLVRAYAYTGLDPENENQRNFHDFLRRHGYKVVSKDIRKYGDGKVKANLDIELVVDMMKTARNLDIAIVVSGDGDFAPAIRAVQEQGVRVEVVSFRGNTSSDLMDVADQFTDITQIAKVEKGSSRSGRRVADDDADLSMTEVPEKQSEGTGDRGRGRGRGRRTTVAASSGSSRGRGRSTAEGRESRAAVNGGESGGALVVLPGEKLSRVAAVRAPLDEDAAEPLADELLEGAEGEESGAEPGTDDGPRRRRRRGGRGRGRGRGQGGQLEEGAIADRAAPTDEEESEEDVRPSPARRAASSFGSVWDSQIGVPAGGAVARGPVVEDEEDLEEPAIPDYLLTERRQRDGARGGRGGRGRGGAYAAALDRERFGGGRGSTPSRYAEQPRREGGYGRPDRDRGGRGGRDDRSGFRGEPRPAPRRSGDEPWSEVPPEIEAMLRAQMNARPSAPRPTSRPAPEPAETEPAAAEATTRRPRGRRAAAPAVEAEVVSEAVVEAPPATAPRSTRARTRKVATPESDAVVAAEPVAEAPARRARTSRSTSTTSTTARRSRSAASTADDSTADASAADSIGTEPATPAAEAAPKRRTTRRKAQPAA